MLISSKHYLLPVHCTLCICRKVNLVFRGVHVSDISTLDSHHRYRTVVIFLPTPLPNGGVIASRKNGRFLKTHSYTRGGVKTF